MLTIDPMSFLDAVTINTARAKLMRAIFGAVNDRAVYDRFQEIRATVSELIRDTLLPLQYTPGRDHPKGEPTYNNNALKRALHRIIKQAFNLAVTMRTQRTIIYADMGNPLLSMIVFDATRMTDIEQPEAVTDDARQAHDDALAIVASRQDIMEKHGKVEVMVQPALVRKGSYVDGRFTNENITVIRKAKVIVRRKFGNLWLSLIFSNKRYSTHQEGRQEEG